MRLGLFICALVLAACDQGKTDIGDLAAGTGSESGGESTTPPIDCAGEDCSNGCCEGFGCNFMNVCEACTPEGEFRGVDGAGCCEGLVTAPSLLCYDSSCDDGMCAPGTVCGGLTDETPQEYILQCTPEVCVSEFTRTLTGDPGLRCLAGNGANECVDTGGGAALIGYEYESEGLFMTIGFDVAILDGYSTEAFNQFYDETHGRVVIPDAGAPLTADLQYGTVSPFVYTEGRLQFTIAVPLADAKAYIPPWSEGCDEDSPTACPCFYEDLGMYQLVVDLPIESP